MDKPSVKLRMLKPYPGIDLKPGDIAFFESSFADELILADAAEYPEEQIDIEIERIALENPEAIAKLTAKLEADIAAGRTQPMETLCAEKLKRRKKK